MRLAILASCLVLLGVVGAARAEDVTTVAAQQTLVRTLIGYEREAWAAFSRRDVAAAPARLAADYSDLLTDGGVLDRAGHVAFFPEANLASYELDQFRVFRLSRDAALVTYRARVRQNTSSGPGPATTALVTSGWARRRGRWLSVFYRENPAPG